LSLRAAYNAAKKWQKDWGTACRIEQVQREWEGEVGRLDRSGLKQALGLAKTKLSTHRLRVKLNARYLRQHDGGYFFTPTITQT
jgi:hypothetical protein